MTPTPIVSQIDAEQCIGCGACESFCPYKAIDMGRFTIAMFCGNPSASS